MTDADSITPEPGPRFDEPGGRESPYSTCSVDLTLSPRLHVPDEGVPLAADLQTGQGVSRALAALTTPDEINPRQGWKLEAREVRPGTQTAERVHLRLPDDLDDRAEGKPILAARVEGRSSLARFGIIVHFAAPTIHAGFEGHITYVRDDVSLRDTLHTLSRHGGLPTHPTSPCSALRSSGPASSSIRTHPRAI